jgi:hypothetical protein
MSQSPHLTPMAVCERVIGTPEQIAAIIHCAPKSPYGWRGASLNRAAGDIPSARHMRALLAHAAAHRLPLTADDLIWGVDEAELAQRLNPHACAPDACPAVGPSSTQPEDCGGGDAPAALLFQSRARRPGAGATLQAEAPARAGIRHPGPHAAANLSGPDAAPGVGHG